MNNGKIEKPVRPKVSLGCERFGFDGLFGRLLGVKAGIFQASIRSESSGPIQIAIRAA